jgi:hypothetical protein
MTRIQGPPIKTNVGSEPAELDEPLRGVVTLLAKRLKRAEPELIDIAVMWLDVIADRRWQWRTEQSRLLAFKPEGFDQIMPSFRDEDGTYMALSANELTYAYNTSRVCRCAIANNYREFMTNDKLVADLRKRFEDYTGPPANKGEVR